MNIYIRLAWSAPTAVLVGRSFDVQWCGEKREFSGARVALSCRGLYGEGAGRVVEVLEHQQVLRFTHK